MKEHVRRGDIQTPKDYYRHPVVRKTIMEAFGGTEGGQLSPQYLVAYGPQIRHQKPGKTPARSFEPTELGAVLETADREPLELMQSFWQRGVESPFREGETVPARSLMVLDVEYYNKSEPERAFTDMRGTFELIEPVYQTVREMLLQYGIDHVAVMTGRGYNFITSVTAESPTMQRLIELGGAIHPHVEGRQAHIPPDTKRKIPVPPTAQKAFQAMGYLAQYLVTQSMSRMREQSSVPVEISDIGMEGIAIDLTPHFVRSVDNTHFGTPGSLYAKPYLNPLIPDHVLQNTNLIMRLVRSRGEQDFGSLEGLIHARQNFWPAIDNLERAGGRIPDGSNGIERLIEDYSTSPLKEFHRSLQHIGDDPSQWERTYRNFDYFNEVLGEPFLKAQENSTEMLNPETLNYLLQKLYDHWGGRVDALPHVTTWLQAVYEDPRMHMGTRWMRHATAATHAQGWTALLLGQRYDK